MGTGRGEGEFRDIPNRGNGTHHRRREIQTHEGVLTMTYFPAYTVARIEKWRGWGYIMTCLTGMALVAGASMIIFLLVRGALRAEYNQGYRMGVLSTKYV